MKISRRNLIKLSGATALAAFATFKMSGIGLVSVANAADLSDLAVAGPLGDKFLGKEDAPVTIIEYASMTCPHCANFHETVLPALKEKYIDTGKVKLIFREFPLDPRAYAASMLARCSDDQFYFPMTDVLFKQQQVWARAEDPREPLLQIAKLAGFTQESFEACLKNQELLDNINETRRKASEQYEVSGTPSFFINCTKFSGDIYLEGLSSAIDSNL